MATRVLCGRDIALLRLSNNITSLTPLRVRGELGADDQ